MKAGIVAVQGAFREHREVLEALGCDAVEVRRPEHLSGVDALLLPGGESTTMVKLIDSSGLRAPLAEMIGDGTPVLGTCAGMILLANTVVDGRPDQWSFAALDVAVRRNGYGRQRESFEAPLTVTGMRGGPFPGVFIRAPVVERYGPGVEVLASWEDVPVLVRDGPVWAAAFHPELSTDLRVHQLFLEEVA